MRLWPDAASLSPALRGEEGDLVSVRISVEPKHLEALLEVLAGLEFPINPQLYHNHAATVVEFPAWGGRLTEIREALRRAGLTVGLSVCGILEDILPGHAASASA
jgi:hypothetical protein